MSEPVSNDNDPAAAPDSRRAISGKRLVKVTKIDNGRTLAIELETGSGDPLFVLLPAAVAADLAAQIVEAKTT